MKDLSTQTKFYSDSFLELEATLPNTHSWLTSIRKQAIEKFDKVGFPTPRDEEWKYTPLNSLTGIRFRPSTGTHASKVTRDHVSPFLHEEWNADTLVFINGQFVSGLSELRGFSSGIKVQSLGAALEEDPETMRTFLFSKRDVPDDGFKLLNTVFLCYGAYIQIARGIKSDVPLHLLFVSTPNQEPLVTPLRNLIVLEEGSEAQVIEHYVGLGEGTYLTNAITDVFLRESAILDHYKIQSERMNAFHIGTVRVEQERGSSFTSNLLSFGGALVRNEIDVLLDGEGAECTLNGLFGARGKQHVDNHTLIKHRKPECKSLEFYKGILDNESTGVFDGKILVLPDAQKSAASQTNKNLLLSENAVMNTKPQLEIRADNVKCTHGAAIGQVDEDALFYLRSRGIKSSEARNLLTHAFGNEVIQKISSMPLRVFADTVFSSWLKDLASGEMA